MNACTLCQDVTSVSTIIDDGQHFCCHGCQAVYNILKAKDQLDQPHEHPIFKQALKTGLISNPALIEQLEKKTLGQHSYEKIYLEISDMWCPSCADVIRLVLLREKGIGKCHIDYTTDVAVIEWQPMEISKDKIFHVIESLGYRPNLLENRSDKVISFNLYLRFSIAAFFSLNIMMFSYPLYATYFDSYAQNAGELFAWLCFYASLPVVTYSAWPIFQKCWNSLRIGLPGMELLVAIGILTSFGLSFYELWNGGTKVYFDSMSVIISFVLLGKIIESKAKFSAKDSLFRLSKSLPRRGRKRFITGDQKFVPVKEIIVGDILVALKGERIILDGVVSEGEGNCDESVMTGEAWPVIKREGANVLAGTIVQHGWIAYKVTALQEQTALQRIIDMVEQGVGQKVEYIRPADSIIRWFVPLVVGLSMMAGILAYFEGDKILVRVMSVLLISCPCAIGIAAPLAEAHLMNAFAKLGVIVRNRGCLRFLGREDVIIFDKTGTVTEGSYKVLSGLESLEALSLKILKTLTSHSNHPVCLAIGEAIDAEQVSLENIEEISGLGVKGKYRNHYYYLGSSKFISLSNIKNGYEYDRAEGIITKVYFSSDTENLAVIFLGDAIKKELPELIKDLSETENILLSGDSEIPVHKVAEACHFDTYKSECSPLEKREWIEKLKAQNSIICMVGDGINDAAALTAAHVGISVLNASDITIQVSDILLTTDRIKTISVVRSLAKKGRSIIKQNLFWAFFYNVIGIFLAVFGFLSPIFSAIAMTCSSIIVILNSKRLGGG